MRVQVLEKQAAIEESPLRAVDLPVPEPGRGEVLLRVSVCGICHTDLHVVEGDLPPHKLPLVPGRQIVGTVEKHGEGISAKLKAGAVLRVKP